MDNPHSYGRYRGSGALVGQRIGGLGMELLDEHDN